MKHKGGIKLKKREKGSVTLFVVIVCIFIITVLVFSIINISNKGINQKQDLENINNTYTQNNSEMESIYQKKTQNIKSNEI